mgnify:FL=1
MKNNKKKVLILSIIGLIGLIIVTIGITYAVFTYTKLGTTDNTVTSGTLKFLYTENTGVKTGIKLTNALPISDTQGKALDGDNNVFDFSIEATNTGTETIPYEVTLRKKSTSTLAEENVKVYLTDRTETIEKEELEPTKYSELTQTNINVGNEIEKTIYKSSVAGGEVSYRKDFRLRMWIDEQSNQTDINGKEFTGMVNVYSNAKVISEEEQELRSNVDIQSITIGDNALTSVTDKDWNYEIQLDNPDTLKLNVIPKYALASVKIEKDNQVISNNSEVSLVGGDNIYKVTITSTDQKNTKEYKINIKVKQAEKVSIFGKQYEVIDAEPTLTTSSNNTSDASGLYKSTATNTGNPTYYFRGNVENNYVSFAGQTWRIVRVNEDGTIRIIMQDGINSNTGYKFNSNYNNYTYMYYTNSEAKTQLENWYQTNIGSKSNLTKNVASGAYYCEQAKAKYSDSWTSGNANMTLYSSYTPDFKCSSDGNNKGVVNASVGLLNYDEVVYAGGYYGQSNSSYYLNNPTIYGWTMSPAGFNGGYPYVWYVDTSGRIVNIYVDATPRLRAVLSLNADTLATGSGTSSDPFVIG